MTSGEGSTQAGLGQFDAGTAGDRPEEEARAVAGDGDGSHAIVDPSDERYPGATERVDVAVTQVDYTLTGSGREERPILHVFGRTGPDGRQLEHVRVHEFRPYFYAPTESLDETDLADVDAITGWEETDDDGDPYESIRGERLTKIFGRTPRDVGEIRDRFDHFEADILFPNRLLIDKDVGSGIRVPERRSDDGAIDIPHEEIEPVDATADLRVLTFDIEVDDRRGFPEDGEEPIVCLSSHDSYREEYIAWLYNAPDGEVPPPEDVADHDLLDDEASVEVRAFESEEGMLSAFMDYVEETNVDLMTGWNFEDFDAPYLIDRLDVLGLDSDRLSRVDEVWSGGYGGPNIKGRVVFDLLYAYQRTKFTELDSYRLDDVAEMELDVGKERYPGDIGDLWEDDPQRLLEYNVRDVELCVELDRKQEIVAFWDEARKIVGCKIEDATTPGDAVDMYVLHEAHGEFALPSKGQQETEEFEGGAVFDPITGVKEMVSVLDLKSLYPMSMTTINASPETQVDPDVYDGETYRTPTGIHFRKEPDGIIREMVDELLDEREEKKALRNDHDPGSSEYERYDRQQAAVKVIMNCFTPDTDVVTPDGVRNIRDLEVGDPVYSLDPDTMEMEVKPVTETHAYPDYRGDLVDIETSKIDFRVTPNHRMLVRKNDKNGITEDEWSLVEAGDLYQSCNYEMPYGWEHNHADSLEQTIDLAELAAEHTDLEVTMSDGGAKVAAQYGVPNVTRSVPTNEFLQFLAWFITEGNVYRAETANYRVKIAQEDEETRDEIESLVDELVDYHYTTDRSVSFSSRVWADVLETLCGGSSETKRIPELVFQASEEQKRAFLKTLIRGDGDRQENSWRYSTISDELRDDVLRLCTHLGLTASHNRDGDTWRIYVTEDGKNSFRMHRSGSRSTAENGVYCVTVEDNHTLLAGRNGKYQFSHNSLYGVFGWDRFRLYDREMSAGVTSTNREVIEFTEQAANELDKEVIYGDSVTGDRPVVVRDPGSQVRIEPIEELFERAESEVVIAVDGARAGSADFPKERRALPGWNALSMNDDGDAEWQPIEEVLRHETDEPVVELQHKFGESTTTRDHSYVVEEDGEFVEAVPGDVDQPLRIPDVPGVETVETIDVYDVLDGYTREYEDGRSVGAENVVTKTKRVHADENWVWFGHEHHGEIDSTVKLTREIDLTTEDGSSFVRLLAAYITEGSASTVETTESRFGASIAESRREWLEGLQEDYHRLFENTTTSIVASDSGGDRTVSYGEENEREVTYDDGTLKLQMMNELAAVFFREFAGQTSRGKRIPSFVFHLPEDLQDLCLDVLVEGDGSREFPRYSEEYAERNFDFETTSHELAAGLSMLLTQRGKKHSLKYRDAKDSYTIRTVDYYRGGRDPVLEERDHDGYVYDLSVAENENFVDAVGGLVLHNTDSVMLELGGDTPKEDAIERSFEIEEHINDRYDEFAREELNAATHRFQIEFEKLYRRFFQAGKKKRYAGHIVWKEGKDVDDIDITGFEYQRSDIAPVTKEVQREVLEMIVTGESTETVTEYVHEVIERFQEGDMDLEEIGVPGGIGKRLNNYETDTAQVRGAKYANLLLGTNFGRGSKPKRLYLEKVHPDFWKRFEAENPDATDDPLYLDFKRDPDVICFQYADQVPEEFRVDYDEMLEKTLKGPIARVIEALGMSWDEVASGQEQTGLGSFM